jgi:hypothetical protein
LRRWLRRWLKVVKRLSVLYFGEYQSAHWERVTQLEKVVEMVVEGGGEIVGAVLR